MIIFQESKVNNVLVDKDAIYSAQGGGTVTSANLVLGQITPYLGEYGISSNPESFAVFGFRKYELFNNRNLQFGVEWQLWRGPMFSSRCCCLGVDCWFLYWD